MYLVNGNASQTIQIADRGFQYGDGLFETIEIINQQPVFLRQHWQRLQTGCRKLLIPIPDIHQLLSEIKAVCMSAPVSGRAVLKLILTRGAGGRGYRLPDNATATRVLSLHPFPDYPESYQQDGVCARICETRLGLSPALAGVKHLNRLEQVLARAEWSDASIQEGIMLDANEHVIEGTMTNLFYYKKKQLFTALLDQSGVAGVMRACVMALCSAHQQPVIEQRYGLSDLLSADEVFLSNAIIGIWPVKQIGGHAFPVGPFSQQLQFWLTSFKMAGTGFDL